MSDATFEAAIAEAVTSASGTLRTVQSPGLAAGYVLAMPEMQAIRSALASMAAVIHEHLGRWHELTADDALVGHLGGGDDPGSVQHIVDWVRFQDTPRKETHDE